MKYIFRFLWFVILFFFACIGIAAVVDDPFQLAGYIVLAGTAYLGVGFHKLILAHYPKQIYLYQDDGKSFWLGWVLMLIPAIAFWRGYDIFATGEYGQDAGELSKGRLLAMLTNWLGDTFGYAVPALISLALGTSFLMLSIRLMKAR